MESESELQTATEFEISERVEAVMVVASWAVVGSAAYIRGMVDASPMSPAEFSEYAAANGPHWPLALFFGGMAVLMATFGVLTWRYYNE